MSAKHESSADRLTRAGHGHGHGAINQPVMTDYVQPVADYYDKLLARALHAIKW